MRSRALAIESRAADHEFMHMRHIYSNGQYVVHSTVQQVQRAYTRGRATGDAQSAVVRLQRASGYAAVHRVAIHRGGAGCA